QRSDSAKISSISLLDPGSCGVYSRARAAPALSLRLGRLSGPRRCFSIEGLMRGESNRGTGAKRKESETGPANRDAVHDGEAGESAAPLRCIEEGRSIYGCPRGRGRLPEAVCA